jgi:uncharacterized SAM-binding protein YcdF (DUF218 family)
VPLLRTARRTGLAVVVALVLAPLVVVAALAATLRLFVWPATDHVGRADAVVVLAGGDGERLDRGLELVRQGVAPTLALSFGPPGLCRGGQPFEVVCFTPSPQTTRGEAESIGELARAHGWSRIVVVTSTPHVTRARLLVGRCYHGTLEVTGATPRTGVSGWIAAVAHEWGGLADAVVERSC